MSLRTVKAITTIESDMETTTVSTSIEIKDLSYPVGLARVRGSGPFERCGVSDNSIILPSPIFLESMKKEASIKEFSTAYISTQTMCRTKGENGKDNSLIWYQYFNKEEINHRPVSEACFDRKLREALINLIYPQFTQVMSMLGGPSIVEGPIITINPDFVDHFSRETNKEDEADEVEIHISLGEN